jgi:hypothetical protein
MKKFSKIWIYGRMAALVLCCTLATWAASHLSGSIWTSSSSGGKVNVNLYDAKTSAYLNGGPQNANASGLPDEFSPYVFQVTDNPAAGPGSALLSADDADCRLVLVSNNRIQGPAAAGPNCTTGAHLPGTTDTANHSLPVQLCPAANSRPDTLSHTAGSVYDGSNWCDTTPNPGGGYKVWITPKANYPAQNTHPSLTDANGNVLLDTKNKAIPDPTYCSSNITFGFCADSSKTDYFKIKDKDKCQGSGCPPSSATILWPLGGHKFYDANANGIWDGSLDGDGNFVPSATEPPINGWKVRNIKSCQEDRTTLAAYLPPFVFTVFGLQVDTVSIPVQDEDLNTRQFFLTTNIGSFETDAFQGIPDTTFTLPGPYPSPNTGNTPFPGGFYQYQSLNAGGHYSTCEVIPDGTGMTFPLGTSTLSGKPVWRATSSTESDDHFLPTDSANFGNLCTGKGGGLTLGFWSNTNGESVLAYGAAYTNKVAKSCDKTADSSNGMKNNLLYLFNNFNLVNATGGYIASATAGNPKLVTPNLSTAYSNTFDPYCFFRSWILGATSTNSAYMLSAQLASMALNVHSNYVNPTALIYAPATLSANAAGFATVADVMAEANDSLGQNPYVVVNKLLNNNVTLKTYQVALKDALDNANNNLGFVQAAGSCPVPVYATASCSTLDQPSSSTATFQPIPENPAQDGFVNDPACKVNELTNIVGSVNCSTSGGTWSDPAVGSPSGSCSCPVNTTVQPNGTCQ